MLNEIVTLAEKAGGAIMEIYARADAGTTYKEDNSPLTLADLAAHHILLEGLPVLTPDIPVISEESASVPYEVRQSWKD
ncbi:MAG: 3'(2'),5'-bisphosphate nucleotidase CysQ, partial [Nitrospirae bacterium]|nr:3'(2'),5'-bisphosphate nucleotidase CysQ [Nitrospirota bacterium]